MKEIDLRVLFMHEQVSLLLSPCIIRLSPRGWGLMGLDPFGWVKKKGKCKLHETFYMFLLMVL